MSYVITEPCIGEKNGACVDVCPAACIHTTPDAPQNYIDPDVCIECEQCVLVCPVDAIFLDREVPGEWTGYIDVNADFFRSHKPARVLGRDEATRMLQAVDAFAARAGISVAAVILDSNGQPLASNPADPLALEDATRKAYTALKYGLATHELKPPPDTADADAQTLLFTAGGFPVVETGDTVGAVGVVGGATPDQDILCCQAAVGALLQAGHAFT